MDSRTINEIGKVLANRVDDAKLSYISDRASIPGTIFHAFYAPLKAYADYSGALDTSAKIFIIAKEVQSGGSTVTMKWASAQMESAWDDRLTLNYY
jgi:hypothetical protein